MRPVYTIITSAAVAASAASAAFVEIEQPVRVHADAEVSVELVGAWAGAAGDVYFLGATDHAGALVASPDTAEPGLGQRLFFSKDAPGATVDLGFFAAGAELHFAYHITRGAGDLVPVGDVFRTDRASDDIQFGWDEDLSTPTHYRLGWEDIRHPQRADWDYRDVVFDVRMTSARAVPVPAPGALVLFTLSTGAAAARRRR